MLAFRELVSRYEGETEHVLAILPDDYAAKIKTIFSKLHTFFSINEATFKQGFAKFDVEVILSTLDFAKTWNTLLTNIRLYGETFSPPADKLPVLTELEAIADYNGLRDKVKDKVVDMQASIQVLTVQTVFATQAESLDQRIDFYSRINRDLRQLQQAARLATHLDNSVEGSQSVRGFYDQTVVHMQALIEALYQRAARQLTKAQRGEAVDWHQINTMLKELSALKQACEQETWFKSMLIDDGGGEKLSPVNAADKIETSLLELLEQKIRACKVMALDRDSDNASQNLEDTVAALVEMESIANSLPLLSDQIKAKIDEALRVVRSDRGPSFFQTLAIKLKASGDGLELINNHACFAGISTSLRNQATSGQKIEDVLIKLSESVDDEPEKHVAISQTQQLQQFYTIFDERYQALLDKYLDPGLDFTANSDKHLGTLRKNLFVIINKLPKASAANPGGVWCTQVKEQIPEIMAHVFAIWTLRDSTAYFDTGEIPDRRQCLKQPHPAQVVGIFRMLAIDQGDGIFDNHLIEILTGEGKSVCMAVTASVLALLDFDVRCACYSEYLSLRDHDDFKPMFEFLRIEDHISYGTFNQICERILNEKGDLRQLVESVIRGNTAPVVELAPSLESTRPRILLVDEVDVFFKRDFYGSLYSPRLTIKDETITKLIDWIWEQHDSDENLNEYNVKRSEEYRACCARFPGWEFLIDSGIEKMLANLKEYKKEQGHNYTVENGVIGYDYQDGTSATKIEGYKTLFAYYYEHHKTRNISKYELKQQIGLIIRCGAFSYAEMLRDMGTFSHILGVTGTLATLTPAERVIVREEFGINRNTYLPSAYGEHNLQFAGNAGVEVVDDDTEYHRELNADIKRTLKSGIRTNSQRAVLVFFDSMEKLNAFKQSLLPEDQSNYGMLTERHSHKERDSEVKRATSSGRVTLLTRALGRGTDFICYDESVANNGGVHVLQTFLSEEISEERQIRGRTARQGQKGSYSMVLRNSDLQKTYGMSTEQVPSLRAGANFYDGLHSVRAEHFKTTYQCLTEKIREFKESCHQPSITLRELVIADGSKDEDKVRAVLKLFNISSSRKITHSRTILLMDATGSMSGLINGVKQTISEVFRRLKETFTHNRLDSTCFEAQLCAYRNYEDGPDSMLQVSPWSTESDRLETFMQGISASGGAMTSGLTYNEAIEIGLCHVNKEADESDGVTQVILIADMPSNTQNDILERRKLTESKWNWKSTKFATPTHYREEVDRLARREPPIPVHSFYVRDAARTEFAEIASTTGGETGELDTNSSRGAELLSNLFAVRVMTDVAGEDDDLRNKLLADYSVSFGV